jgi:GT2 family glycosyltransferase
MSAIQVVIAIVSYKSAALTIDCLRSIDADRSTQGIELSVIVVDNSSGDASAIAQSISANSWSSWVTLLTAPKNGGFGYGNNLAFRHAYEKGRPDYFHLLNPDTLVRKGAVSALVRFLEAHPQVGIVGGSFEFPNGDEWPVAFRFPSILSEVAAGVQLGLVTRMLQSWVVPVELRPEPQQVDWISGASMMIRRSVLDAIGGFDENYFLYFEETDFCFRAKKAGILTWYVPESRIMHITGQSTNVTKRNVAPRRLPAYWFESRRRYLVMSYGAAYATAADAAAILANVVGSLKRILQRRRDLGIPHFALDLASHSILWPRNRQCAGVKPHIPHFLEQAPAKKTTVASLPSCERLEIL